jgi:hypothetical protein
VQHVAVDLAIVLEIDGTDGVQDTGRVLASRVLDLTSVAGVVEEVRGTWFTYEPIDGRLHRLVKGRE